MGLWVLVFGAVPLLFAVFITWGYTAIVEGAARVMAAQAWLIEQHTKWRLAKHGLSNEQVLETLLSLDQFTFYMLDGPCVCIKGADGRHEFVFPSSTLHPAESRPPSEPLRSETTCEASSSSPSAAT